VNKSGRNEERGRRPLLATTVNMAARHKTALHICERDDPLYYGEDARKRGVENA